MNPLVSQVLRQEKRWSAEFAALRQVCRASGLEEQCKWGKPCYTLAGANVVLIHGFKNYCALLFMQGALLQDGSGVLTQQTPNVQAARQFRFTELEQINAQIDLIKALISEAIAIERSGARVEMKSVAQFEVVDALRQRMDAQPELALAFAALTPGRQKAYLLYFSSAKQPATRIARVEKNIARILSGLGLND